MCSYGLDECSRKLDQMTDFCGHGSEPLLFLKSREFLNTWSQNPHPDFKIYAVWNKSPFFSVVEFSVSSKKNSWIASLLKLGPIACPETSVTNHLSTLRKNQERRRFQDNFLWNVMLQVIRLRAFVL